MTEHPSRVHVTLGEGNTPLVQSVRIGPTLGLDRLLFKLENCNPSGSYKDRFVRAEIERILGLKIKACVATSSGNTGASLAAYCARFGLQSLIVVNEAVPAGKLTQMQAHGARVFRVKNFIKSPGVTENVYECLSKLSRGRRLALVVSAYRYCPTGMAGVEQLASELRDQCGSPIDHVFLPVGGGGLFTAVCRGFGMPSHGRPRLHAVQPAGCPTVVAAFERRDNEIRLVESTTRISGLSVPFDLDAALALDHLRQCGGHGFAVGDDEVFEAQRMILDQEGIYTEPAGAAALAGLRRAVGRGIVCRNETVICLVTGHGFKDPESVELAAARYPSSAIQVSELESTITETISCA